MPTGISIEELDNMLFSPFEMNEEDYEIEESDLHLINQIEITLAHQYQYMSEDKFNGKFTLNSKNPMYHLKPISIF